MAKTSLQFETAHYLCKCLTIHVRFQWNLSFESCAAIEPAAGMRHAMPYHGWASVFGMWERKKIGCIFHFSGINKVDMTACLWTTLPLCKLIQRTKSIAKLISVNSKWGMERERQREKNGAHTSWRTNSYVHFKPLTIDFVRIPA